MAIVGGFVEGAVPMTARSYGGLITPEVIVLHDTAGRLEKHGTARWLQDSPRGVSVHFVIERDGTVVQQVPVDRRAGHAGKSVYHGRGDVNAFSIGIEIVNPGKMTRQGDFAVPWFKHRYPIDNTILSVETPEHGAGYWMDYTAEQIEAVAALCGVLVEEIPTIRDITTHWYISPGRKVDPGPLFPLEALHSHVFGRESPADVAAIAASTPVAPKDGLEQFVQIDVPGDTLNMRRRPSFNPNVIAAIPSETYVPVLRAGRFDGVDWLLVRYAGQEGWIVASYAEFVAFGDVK